MSFFIKNYISKISPLDIYNFGVENGIDLTDDETDIIYDLIINKWEEIIYGDFSSLISNVRGIDEEKIRKIESLLYEYKEKYKDYL